MVLLLDTPTRLGRLIPLQCYASDMLITIYIDVRVLSMQPHNSVVRTEVISLCAPNVDTMNSWIAASRLVKVRQTNDII